MPRELKIVNITGDERYQLDQYYLLRKRRDSPTLSERERKPYISACLSREEAGVRLAKKSA